MRLLGCLLVLPWLTALAQPANALGGAAAVWFHSAFNLALALLAIGFTGPLAALLARLLPEEAQSDEPGMPRYLDEAGLEVANIGLANATREVLRLADMASLMLRATSGLLQRPEAKVAAEIRRQDQALDQLSAAIRAYLADLGQDGLGDSDADRAQEILLFAINIEHIGDLVANSLLPLAMRWAGRSRAGSEFELGRMLPLQAAIEESLHLAISAFLREDLDAALRLVARKKLLQRLEADASRERFRRLRDDRGAWVESGDVFQRILRDYRRIHHHVTALAYPLLERSGIDPMAKRPDEPGQGGIGMRLLICAGRHFRTPNACAWRSTSATACNRWRCSATCCMPAAACRTRPSAGAASVARIRAPTIIRSAVAATTPCASMARPSSARPRRTWCWCFPVGAWPANWYRSRTLPTSR